jgi:hypothetical protein
MAGYKIQLKLPLDFYMVTDHSEYMGILPKTQEPENEVSLQHRRSLSCCAAITQRIGLRDLITIIGSITGSAPERFQNSYSLKFPTRSGRKLSKSPMKTTNRASSRPSQPTNGLPRGPAGTQNLHRNIIFRSSDSVPGITLLQLRFCQARRTLGLHGWFEGNRTLAYWRFPITLTSAMG